MSRPSTGKLHPLPRKAAFLQRAVPSPNTVSCWNNKIFTTGEEPLIGKNVLVEVIISQWIAAELAGGADIAFYIGDR
jgi:hypothetical protein